MTKALPTQAEIDAGPHADLGNIPTDYLPAMPLVGTLSVLPEHVKSCVVAYGDARVAVAVRAMNARAQPAPVQQLIDWVVERWNAEVKHRPMVNIHRRSLDDAWRQMLRHLGVDDRERLGPTHDELRAEIGSKEWEAMNGKAAPVQPPKEQA